MSTTGKARKIDEETPLLGEMAVAMKKKQQKPKRIDSIDVMRGLTMTMTIFCDSTGVWLPQITHVLWNGLQVADYVLPWFLVIVGYSMAISLKWKGNNAIHWDKFKKSFIRFLKLIGLGIWLYSLRSHDGPITPCFKMWVMIFTDPLYFLNHFRIFNVLQRIGWCFIVICAVHLFVPKTKATDTNLSSGLQIFSFNLFAWIFVIALLILHWIVLMNVELSGCKSWEDDNAPSMCSIIGYIDRTIFGSDHLYQPELGFDPDGFFTSLPAMFTVYCGHHIGTMMWKLQPDRFLKEAGVFTFICYIIALALRYGAGMPYNKVVYSPSFNFMMIATCNTGLIIYYLLLDYPGFQEKRDSAFFKFMYTTSRPFKWVGMNSILIWCLLCIDPVTIHTFVMVWPDIAPNSVWAYLVGLFNIFVFAVLALWLFRIKWFFKV